MLVVSRSLPSFSLLYWSDRNLDVVLVEAVPKKRGGAIGSTALVASKAIVPTMTTSPTRCKAGCRCVTTSEVGPQMVLPRFQRTTDQDSHAIWLHLTRCIPDTKPTASPSFETALSMQISPLTP